MKAMDANWTRDACKIVEREMIASRRPLRILEAGGGARSSIPIQGAEYTVIDISPEQLDRNTYATDRLLGNLESFDYGVRRFDIVVFWDVLEHLRDPQQALRRAAAALASGGLLIIKGPILKSTKSLITRLTPWRVHVLFYRYVLGSQNAGKPGYAPFPTEHAFDADDDELRMAITDMRLKEVFYSRQVSSHVDRLKVKALPLYWLYEALSFGMRVITASHYGSTETDFLLVGRKVR